MTTISYTKKTPPAKLVFAIVLLLLGCWVLVSGGFVFGSIFMAFGILMLNKEGSEIDLSHKTYRNIDSLFGIRFGTWKPLPEIEYISVFKTKESQRINVISVSATVTSDIILLNLFYSGNKKITAYKTIDKDDAFKVAKHLSLALDAAILDATDREKKWL